MDVRTLGSMTATALWVVAVALLVTGSVAGDRVVLIGWALFAAVVAAIVTAWRLLEGHHTRIMDYLAHQDLRVSAAVTSALRGSREGRPTSLH